MTTRADQESETHFRIRAAEQSYPPNLNLEAIEIAAAHVRESKNLGTHLDVAVARGLADVVPDLVAEIRRMREEG